MQKRRHDTGWTSTDARLNGWSEQDTAPQPIAGTSTEQSAIEAWLEDESPYMSLRTSRDRRRAPR